jgi:hypothetical protein
MSLKDKYSKYNLTHTHFFTLFKEEVFLHDINTETNIGDSFKHNLNSVISILNIPITLSVSRTKIHVYEKFLTSELILNAPAPNFTDKPEEQLQKEENEGRERAYKNAEKQFLEELQSKEGAKRFWDITFQFLEDCLDQNENLKSASREILKQSIVLLWSTFEVLVRDGVIQVLNLNPDLFKSFNIKSIPEDTLEEYDYEVKSHLGDIYADQRDWSNLKTIRDSIQLIWPSNGGIQKKLKDDLLYKLNQKRHLIVHRKGIVDKQYNSLTSDNFIIGEEIPIDPDDIKNYLNLVKEIGLELLVGFQQKLKDFES